MEIFLCLPICIVAFFGARSCQKKRKNYIQFSQELAGIVVSWSKYIKIVLGNKKQTRYSLTVRANNGNEYKIDTANRKAKKYKENSSVTLLIPQNYTSNTDENNQIILKDEINYYLMTVIIGYFISVLSFATGIFCLYFFLTDE